MSPSVTVYVASFNTRGATELSVRTLQRLAGHPFRLVVGDSGSTDGSTEMLETLAARGWLELQRADGPRAHADWIDSWLADCRTDYAVFVDSDVEFLRAGWLAELVEAAAEAGAAVACGELLASGSFVEPVASRRVHGAARPSPWLFLVDVERVRRLGVSFAFYTEETSRVPEGIVAYDVGARLFAELEAHGGRWVEMPRRYRRGAYRHYGGLSWLPVEGRRGRKKLRDLRRVERRLARELRIEAGGGVRARGVELAAGIFRRAPAVRGKAAAGLRLQRALMGPRPDGLVLPVRMRDGCTLRLDLGSPTERAAVWTGVYEPDLQERLLDLLPPSAHVIDVGANVGFYAVPLARRLRELGGRLYAFEPVSANHARLRENLAANGLNGTVRTFRLALGDRAGSVELQLERGAPTGNAVAFPPGDGDRADDVAPLDTLDAVAEREGITACHLVKLDVEGGELAVLRGGRGLLAAHRPVVLAELNGHWMDQFGWTYDDLARFAGELGYEVRRLPGHALLLPAEAASS